MWSVTKSSRVAEQCDVNIHSHSRRLFKKAYLSPLERDLRGKVSLNDSCLLSNSDGEKIKQAVGSLVVRASDSRPEGLGSMLDVTKYPPSAHGFTCRNCGGGDRGRVAIYRPFGEVSLSLNRTVTCMVLKANDRRSSCPCHDEFRGPRSDYVRQVALATTTTNKTKFYEDLMEDDCDDFSVIQ
ncbi:uncharacterized protein TNCV_2518341 [Trichonephila clavipes]|nr:uncharacterized protein TNCV_2518341 [Trichonephila clavipes]